MSTKNQVFRQLLTHLSAAGAAAFTASAASAQITVVPVNENVGVPAGDLSSFTSSLPGANQFMIQQIGLSGFNPTSGLVILNAIWFSNFSVGVRAVNYTQAALGPVGKTFSQIGTRARTSSNIIDFVGPGGPDAATFHDQYFAFRFQDAANSSQTDYGWIEASLTDGSYNGLNLNIVAYAYDTSGARILTGETTSVPEPSPALALAAFGALTLGAAGMRRLKALQT